MNIKIAFHKFMVRKIFKAWHRFLFWRNKDQFYAACAPQNFDDDEFIAKYMLERNRSDTPLTLFQQPENSKDASEKAQWNGGFYNLEQKENTETNSLPINLSDHEQQL